MKKIFYTLTFLLDTFILKAQNIAISNNGATPDPSAMLDISSNEKGILIPGLRTTSIEKK